MPLDPSKALHFDSWDALLRWLPEASESQLMTVFVWTGDQAAPGGDARRLAQVRKQAFELLVQRTKERLFTYLVHRCHCHDPSLAEDVVQQVLLKVYLRAEQYDPDRSFWGWLYRIAHNEHIDTLRGLKPGDIGRGQTGHGDADLEDWLDERAITKHTPESTALAEEELRLVEQAVAALPTMQRTIVRLKREGIKGKDIAKQLGRSQAYVSQLYHEAEEILREQLAR